MKTELLELIIHGPNSDSSDYFEKVRKYFIEYILCGDFTLALNQFETLETFNNYNVNYPLVREKLICLIFSKKLLIIRNFIH